MHVVKGIVMSAMVVFALAAPGVVGAIDVDGPDDCLRTGTDFGDAPEGIDAYPGIPGNFPTCLAPGGTGTQELACPAISTAPGPTGYVSHFYEPDGFWLGCTSGQPPLGIDPEPDGKVAPWTGGGPAPSACADIPTDCAEIPWAGFGWWQDECYGTDDAALAGATPFTACVSSTVVFEAYNCQQVDREVFLNILVDWNQDGDWNDNFMCPGGACAYEWAVKNAVILLPPGCNQVTSPSFLAGPSPGHGWMRITLSSVPVGDDFPWNGTAQIGELPGGETEDYPVDIEGDECDVYQDFGDAPEDVQAYAGVPGHFPTCTMPSAPGTQELAPGCFVLSTAPGATGYVEHVRNLGDPWAVWLGCPGVDSETDGKTNDNGAPNSVCAPTTPAVDCFEPVWLNFGQDECTGDGVDAGIQNPVTFTACQYGDVTFDAYNCGATSVAAYINILVDWNHDGDWNDNFDCAGVGCAYEWAVKNHQITLPPGCTTFTSPQFLAGPFAGIPGTPQEGWMRITITRKWVGDDFPWAGSIGEPGDVYATGETEDYPVEILSGEECEIYNDFGDAPENALAYVGVTGRFPTCTTPSAPGTQELFCAARGTAPGTTGYVEHVRTSSDPFAIWLGCSTPGVDSELDGKTNSNGAANSVCSNVPVDCWEPWWLSFGQDECYTDAADAGVHGGITFQSCQPAAVTYDAYNCGTTDVDAYLNILVDWNHDGDWNDNFDCGAAGCAHEWAVKNHPIVLPPGCSTLTSPQILAGPYYGARPQEGWLRITITVVPVHDDFPWAGSVGEAGDVYRTGETEDYPITVQPGDECEIQYEDYGDAPEDTKAYTWGQPGRFPTCLSSAPAGTQEIECGAPVSTVPGPTGFVRHVATAFDPTHFWLGCGAAYPGGVDGEADGKMNQGPGLSSFCNPGVIADCLEPAFGVMQFAQDECTGDGVDAGVNSPVSFPNCGTHMIHFDATNCGTTPIEVYLNVLVDWNGDADWNDNIVCPDGTCAYEWAVQNHPITLAPGCNPYVTPNFQTGPHPGLSWMRITLTRDPVSKDFPWAGSATTPGEEFSGGETEDYPAVIPPLDVGDPDVPDGMSLAPTWPNPATAFAVVRFALPHTAHVNLAVFDVTGRKVRTLVSGDQVAGRHTVQWNFRSDDGTRVPVGLYLVKLQVGGTVLTRPAVRVE